MKQPRRKDIKNIMSREDRLENILKHLLNNKDFLNDDFYVNQIKQEVLSYEK